VKTRHSANHGGVKCAASEAKPDEADFDHGGTNMSQNVNAKEYRTFESPAEGFLRNAKLPEGAASFRMSNHL
jgi:hypothetical protein